jgi:hypothetical protein
MLSRLKRYIQTQCKTQRRPGRQIDKYKERGELQFYASRNVVYRVSQQSLANIKSLPKRKKHCQQHRLV